MSELTQGERVPVRTRPNPTRTFVLIFGALLIIGLTLVFGWKLFNDAQSLTTSGPAPDFTLPLFDGGQVMLSELQGNVVVVNFWASWCIPCRDEAPFMERAWQRFQDQNVMFIGVDYLDTDKEAQAFLEEFGITYPNGPDIGTKISDKYHISGVPETFFIAKDGRLGDMQIGPLTEARLISAIEILLQE